MSTNTFKDDVLNTSVSSDSMCVKINIKHNCVDCLYNDVCKHKEAHRDNSYCKHYRDVQKNIHLKAVPGDTVWLTQWYKTPKNTIVSRTILYVSFHEDKTVYHCKDGCFDESGFGDYALRSLDAAKIVLSLRGN